MWERKIILSLEILILEVFSKHKQFSQAKFKIIQYVENITHYKLGILWRGTEKNIYIGIAQYNKTEPEGKLCKKCIRNRVKLKPNTIQLPTNAETNKCF